MSRTHWKGLGSLLFPAAAVLAGCDAQPEPTGPGAAPAAPPKHPAMIEPVSKEAPQAKGASPALPADHPPIAGQPAAGAPPAGSGGGAAAGAGAEGGGVEAKLKGLGLAVKVPEGWKEDPTPRPMRLTTVRLPRAEGDSRDGEMLISLSGGGLERNIDRWKDQFQERPEPVVTKRDAGGLQVTVVDLEGTYAGMGGGAAEPGTKLLGAIVQVPGMDQSVFFKAWGPKATMERWRSSFDAFVASIQQAK
ncbi:MAG: hypothetical protein HY721_12190 [Planctomycetes bacterium]|nr:hypothetical protein [Planctomycetota bacterium]